MKIIVNAENTPYQIWQIRLLAESVRLLGIEHELVLLLSGEGSADLDDLPVELNLIANISVHPRSGDHYSPYNKPYALMTWLDTLADLDFDCLIVDPDCIFLKKTKFERPPIGSAIMQEYAHMTPFGTVGKKLLSELGWVYPNLPQPGGIPIVVHASTLAKVAKRWLEFTEVIRGREDLRAAAGWVAEMWGCTLAFAEAGVRLYFRQMAHDTFDHHSHAPILHYTGSVKARSSDLVWDKRTYQPWTTIDESLFVGYPPFVQLAKLINAYGQSRTCQPTDQ